MEKTNLGKAMEVAELITEHTDYKADIVHKGLSSYLTGYTIIINVSMFKKISLIFNTNEQLIYYTNKKELNKFETETLTKIEKAIEKEIIIKDIKDLNGG